MGVSPGRAEDRAPSWDLVDRKKPAASAYLLCHQLHLSDVGRHGLLPAHLAQAVPGIPGGQRAVRGWLTAEACLPGW